MYTVKTFRTKKALREAVAAGEQVDTFQPGGMFPMCVYDDHHRVGAPVLCNHPERDGVIYLEGPHYPEPHRWYAQATVKGGVIVRVK